jgi:hypothetical protein
VKANQGAAGVDGQSIADFAADLKNNLFKVWNRIIGDVLPAGAGGGDAETAWRRHQDADPSLWVVGRVTTQAPTRGHFAGAADIRNALGTLGLCGGP